MLRRVHQCDTVCIDKTSSAEISEAINSMFQWYKQSTICYAYLTDVIVPPNTDVILSSQDGFVKLNPCLGDIVSESRWFARGWTLQELIAPKEVRFFAKDWAFLGSKTHSQFVPHHLKPALNEDLVEITGILDMFLVSDNLSQASLAQKMSWASRRDTTRTEDVAYSLLGIFGVNMPLLYGEGERAFLRLQVCQSSQTLKKAMCA